MGQHFMHHMLVVSKCNRTPIHLLCMSREQKLAYYRPCAHVHTLGTTLIVVAEFLVHTQRAVVLGSMTVVLLPDPAY